MTHNNTLSTSTSQATTISNSFVEKGFNVPVVKNKKKHSSFFSLIKAILLPCHCQNTSNRKRKPTAPKSLSMVDDCSVKPYHSSESLTMVDTAPCQPWIVPSEYHKHISESNIEHQWIFRTGWTPQPEPLAFMDRDWCKNCNTFIKKDSIQCSHCNHINPLGQQQQRSKLTYINEY